MLERINSTVESATTQSAVALHGLHAASLNRRYNRNEERLDGLEHDAAFYHALGEIATQVTEDESRIDNPGKWNHGHSTNLPPKVFKEVNAFSSQSDFHEEMIGRSPGISNKTVKPPKHQIFTRADMIDPRDGSVIAPRNRKQRKAERKAAKLIHKIRTEREAQDDRRSMLRNTGPNLFWQTALHRIQDRMWDNDRIKSGRISAFEAETNKKMRGTSYNMEQGEWRLLRRGEETIGIDSAMLESKTVTKSERAIRKHNRLARRSHKLAAKRREAVIKKNEAKARS